ncbi:hypothetical protein COB52_03950 [Candidatus Kaiserbacteria bacterium]|nr:MAG: hypothetical protein COB52_03950 [Candidatus Kaiserbacteria bacterium]
MADQIANAPQYERGPVAIRGSGSTWANQISSIWYPLIWGILIWLPTLLSFGGGLFTIVISWILAGWLCYYDIPPNSNAVLRRLGAYSPKILGAGKQFNHPWPLYTLKKLKDIMSLEPELFSMSPKDVDTFEGDGKDGGQITADLTVTLRVLFPLLFLLCGGWTKVLPQIKRAIESAVRQYCAVRSFSDLKNEKDNGSAAAIFRGAVESFYTLEYEGEGKYGWYEKFISVSGFTLIGYILRWGVEIFTLEVQDFTPTSEGLKAAQDLPAIAKKKADADNLSTDAFNERTRRLRAENPDASPDEILYMAGALSGVTEAKRISIGGNSKTPIMLQQ